jgi:hypothetical protein
MLGRYVHARAVAIAVVARIIGRTGKLQDNAAAVRGARLLDIVTYAQAGAIAVIAQNIGITKNLR